MRHVTRVYPSPVHICASAVRFAPGPLLCFAVGFRYTDPKHRSAGAVWLPLGMEGNVIPRKLTERYGIELPFVSAGMGFISLPPLVATVSNAGGLGQLACGAAPAGILAEMIGATRERTSRPFGVNFIIETTAFGPLTTDAHIEVCVKP